MSHPIGKGTDGEGVHWDGIRAVAASGATQDWPIEMGRNVIFHGDCRGDIQDIFLSDFPVGVYFTGSIIGNLTAAASTHVITVSTAKDMVIKANTALGQIDGADYVNTTCRLKIGEVGRAGTVRVEDNLSEAAPIVGAGIIPTGSVNLGLAGSTTPYTTVLAGTTFAPNTRAECLTQFDVISGAAGATAAAVTFATNCPGSDGVTHVD